MKSKLGPTILLILDGWGLSPSWGGNALAMNNPKRIDALWRNYPHAVLQALSAISSGEVVGDSHLGHTMIGSGRIVESNLGRINKTITSRQFYKNEVLLGAINWAKRNKSNLHLLGLISDGGVHSHVDHLLALLNLCHREDFNRVFIDAITDGTDSGPTNALRFVEKIQNKMSELGIGAFSSISGRHWAMDRDENWNRIKKYYQVLCKGSVKPVETIVEAITSNYHLGQNDEFIEPNKVLKKDGAQNVIKNGDAVIFFNFREDRSRELTRMFLDQNFGNMFWRPQKFNDLYFATFVSYARELPAKVAFPEKIHTNTLSEVLSKANFRQLKVAESQKQAHITSFFNGGEENPWPGEERKIISSPNVASYDQRPEMSAPAVANAVINGLKSNKYDFIVANFANVDMVAHTGNIIATGQAIQVVDQQVGRIVEANVRAGGTTIITADHGNAEQMIELKKSLSSEETSHTMNPVPFIVVSPKNRKNLVQSALINRSNSLAKIMTTKSTLADIAPTILEILDLPKPKEMTGHSLLKETE